MAMFNDYQLENGSIWEFFYYEKKNIPVDEVAIDHQTRSVVQDTFNPPPGLSPAEYSQLFLNHFLKTRERSREIAENDHTLVRYKILSQLGNRECLDELLKIESHENFHRWENPNDIEYFRNLSKSYLYG
jgi:hypothetical protein